MLRNYLDRIEVVEWLKRRAYDQHGLGSKPFRCVVGKDTLQQFPCLVSWQAVLNHNNISIKLQADRNILASPEAGRGNCLPWVLAPLLRVRRINIEINKKNKEVEMSMTRFL